MRETLRILFVDAAPFHGGAQESMACLFRHPPAGLRAGLMSAQAPDMPLPLAATAAGWPVSRFSCRHWRATPLGLWELWRDRRNFQQAWRTHIAAHGLPERIHANGERTMLLLADIVPARVPIILHVRDIRMPGFVRSFADPRAQALIAASQFVAAALPLSAPSTRFIVPNPVEPPPACHAPVPVPAGPFLLLAADFSAWKRHDLFIEMLAEIRREQPDLCGVILGRSRDAAGMRLLAALRQQIAAAGLTDAVTLITDCSDIRPWLAAAAAVVSVAEAEPFGRSVAEALAFGKPVICTADGGPAEFLAGSPAGILCNPDPVSLATGWRQCRRLLDTRGAQVAAAARHRAAPLAPEHVWAQLLAACDLAGAEDSRQ
jgi:glycosyltransferase involved in cell wall biosynthesis